VPLTPPPLLCLSPVFTSSLSLSKHHGVDCAGWRSSSRRCCPVGGAGQSPLPGCHSSSLGCSSPPPSSTEGARADGTRDCSEKTCNF
jgi:hypothetical protein